MKRFYEQAAWVATEAGFAIELDERPVRTPERALLAVPGAALADAIVGEWRAQGEKIDPASMPMTGLANATIDRVLTAPGDFRGQIAAYGASDLLCYRAEGPTDLVERQGAHWDPLLDWSARELGCHWIVTNSMMPVDQPALTLAGLRDEVEALDPWLLAGLSKIVTIGGTLVGGLALMKRNIDIERLWAAVTVDELWQAEKWGFDEEAQALLAARYEDYGQAARYCALVATGHSG